MNSVHSVSRESFINYWKDFGTFGWRQILPHAYWVGGVALIALTSRLLDPDYSYGLLALVTAIAWVVLFPTLGIRWYHQHYAKFIRCPSCGDWFGQDRSGAYRGPDPKFRDIIHTGRCFKCGMSILSDHPGSSAEIAFRLAESETIDETAET